MKKLFFALISLSFYTASAQTSAYFDGTNTAYAIGNLMQFQTTEQVQLTVEAWVKRDTAIATYGAGYTQTIISYFNNNIDFLNILDITLVDDSVRATHSSILTSGFYPSDTMWHNIALVCDTTKDTAAITGLDSITLYVDGIKQSSSIGSKVVAGIGTGHDLTIGAYNLQTMERPWIGHISNVVIYDSAMYAGNFIPNCAYDTTQFVNGTVTVPVDFLITFNDNDTAYYNIAHAGGNGKLKELGIQYNYQTAPCLPSTLIENVANAESITVYPNPVEDVLNISSSIGIKKVELLDLFGRIILSTTGDDRHMIIDFRNINSGLYFLKINNNFNEKIIKN